MSPFDTAVIAWTVLAFAVMPYLFFRAAPYGRHSPDGSRFTVPARLGWCLMEAPSALVFAWFFLRGPSVTLGHWALFAAWQAHYVYRAFVYPFRLSNGQRPMPFLIMASSFFFTTVNGFFNGYSTPRADVTGASLARVALGLAVFAAGYAINHHSDHVLRTLRAPGETGYKIPRGGLYRWVSSPNYLGEIIEWTGWAIASGTLAGLSFAVWTFANLAPRARAHHAWYRERFPDYPPERKALIPGLF